MAKRPAPRRKINPFDVQKPKGPRVRQPPRSEPYSPRQMGHIDRQAATEEEAAFADSGRHAYLPADARNSRVSRAALDAARLRMSGARLEEEDERDEEEPDDLEDEGHAGDPGEWEREQADNPVAAQLDRALWSPQSVAAIRQTQPQPPHPAIEFDFAMPKPTLAVEKTTPAGHGPITHSSGITLSPILVGDIDRLWDWLRADADHGYAFLGKTFATSVELHQFARLIVTQFEPNALAMLRAIYYKDQHIGFAMLAPILAAERTALMHLYLRKDVRGSLYQLARPLVELAMVVAPGVHLAVYAADVQWAKLYRSVLGPLGFVEHVMFVR